MELSKVEKIYMVSLISNLLLKSEENHIKYVKIAWYKDDEKIFEKILEKLLTNLD